MGNWTTYPEIKTVYDLDKLLWYADDTIFKWNEIEEKKYGTLNYGAVRCTGKFDGNFDYNRGIMLIRIYTYIEPCQKGNHKYQPRVLITNIDDGVWDATTVGQYDTVEEANKITKAVYEGYKEYEDQNYGNSLPTEEELNKFLMTHGMWGVCTG